jgi:hypothetical protein
MGRRYRRRADLDSPWWWAGALIVVTVRLVLLAVVLVVLLGWALIALPIAGVAKLTGNDELAHSMVDFLVIHGPFRRRGRRC